MPKLGLLISCITLLMLTISQSLHAEPRLRSLAIHTELGQELFIGALFSDVASASPEVLLNPQEASRLEIKILAEDGFSSRRFSRLWIESIAINQTAAVLGAQAQNVINFDQLFNTRLLKNDHLIITNTPNRGVSFTLNGAPLGIISDNQFFPVLLSTWIGRVPLSSSFRDSILSTQAPDAAVESRFLSLQPTQSRRQQIANHASLASSSQADEAAEVAATQPTIEKPVIDKPAIEKPVLDKPLVAPAPVAAAAPRTVTPAPAASVPQALPREEEDEPDAQPLLTAQTLLARQYYLNDVIVKIHQQIRYPARALKRRQEGNVRLKVTLDRRGNILNTVFLETAEHVLLNKEAARAVNQADPLPPVPDAIAGNTVDVTIPLRFALPR